MEGPQCGYGGIPGEESRVLQNAPSDHDGIRIRLQGEQPAQGAIPGGGMVGIRQIPVITEGNGKGTGGGLEGLRVHLSAVALPLQSGVEDQLDRKSVV